jgi:hypothetical protein
MRKRIRVSQKFDPQSGLTQQALANSCDINQIMARARRTGMIPMPRAGSYGVSAPTYVEAMRTVADAESHFASLPSRIRDRFSNSPARFLDFVNDLKNRAEMVELGLSTQHLPPESNDAPAKQVRGKQPEAAPAPESGEPSA